jgi:hypothetical protein
MWKRLYYVVYLKGIRYSVHTPTISYGASDLSSLLLLFFFFSITVLHSCRSSGVQILEALHSDPASSLSVEQEKSAKILKPPIRFVNMVTTL